MGVLSAKNLRELARSPQGVKAIRYTLTSVVSVIVSLAVLTFLHGLLGWGAQAANITSVSVATIPSYVLNRRWAWGKRGKSHLFREVIPFWVLAFIGLAFSTWAADWADTTFHRSTLAVDIAQVGSFGVLWVVKFIIFNELMFKNRPEELEGYPALDGRTGLPT